MRSLVHPAYYRVLFGAQHFNEPISSSVGNLRYPVHCSKTCWYVASIGSVGDVFVIFYRHHIDRVCSQWRRSITRHLTMLTNSWELLMNNWELIVDVSGYLRDNSEFVGEIVTSVSENWVFVCGCLDFISRHWNMFNYWLTTLSRSLRMIEQGREYITPPANEEVSLRRGFLIGLWKFLSSIRLVAHFPNQPYNTSARRLHRFRLREPAVGLLGVLAAPAPNPPRRIYRNRLREPAVGLLGVLAAPAPGVLFYWTEKNVAIPVQSPFSCLDNAFRFHHA